MADGNMISVRNLTKTFKVERGTVHAVTDVSFDIARGETLALVGESGCGKSTLGRMILRTIEPDSGTVMLEGTDITALRGEKLRRMRSRMQLVFQDPYASLDPRMKIEDIISEPLRAFDYPKDEIRKTLDELVARTGIPLDSLGKYPHQFSGGQRQRVGIARALALHPGFIVCDEPVSALDVSIQAQTLNLLRELQSEFDLTYLFISHDLGVVNYLADRVCVMFLGQICEIGPAREVFFRPAHPYTKLLISSTPQIGKRRQDVPALLADDMPSPLNPPSGCRFRSRCPYADSVCAKEHPALEGKDGHSFACFHPLEGRGAL